tara:strand:- start:1207 stop:1929 length:723 start_codon:yes stop_codon:yes gene_type:complete
MAVDFVWDNVVIGTSLAALIEAQKTNCPVLFNKEPAFFKFKKLDSGEYEHEKWQQIASDLSLRGLNPFGDKISSIRIKQNKIEVFCNNKKYAVGCENIKFFDEDNIENFPFSGVDVRNYRVYDWFRVISGANHDHRLLETTDQFVNKIYFFSKINLPKYKDCVSESTINKENLNRVDYTSTMARHKAIDVMTKAGILGTKHTKTYRYPIKMKLIERQIIKIKEEVIKQKDNYTLDTREFK